MHWQLDTFREEQCRTRKDHAATNLAMMRQGGEDKTGETIAIPLLLEC
jgi:predicted transposase YbfD/YdcC